MTDELLDRVRDGDQDAIAELFAQHRQRLRTMIELRMDPRLAGRVDPSDVLQDTFIDLNKLIHEFQGWRLAVLSLAPIKSGAPTDLPASVSSGSTETICIPRSFAGQWADARRLFHLTRFAIDGANHVSQ